jgi:hypothetical protein
MALRMQNRKDASRLLDDLRTTHPEFYKALTNPKGAIVFGYYDGTNPVFFKTPNTFPSIINPQQENPENLIDIEESLLDGATYQLLHNDLPREQQEGGRINVKPAVQYFPLHLRIDNTIAIYPVDDQYQHIYAALQRQNTSDENNFNRDAGAALSRGDNGTFTINQEGHIWHINAEDIAAEACFERLQAIRIHPTIPLDTIQTLMPPLRESGDNSGKKVIDPHQRWGLDNVNRPRRLIV